MTDKLPISVFMIAKNEADRISSPIKSVIDWVDEVIVVDSGSSDNTLELSKELGANAVFRAWTGYGDQKNHGHELCRNTWVLNIDADETVSEELKNELFALFKDGKQPEFMAYHIPIVIVSRFENSARPFAPSNDPVRFYNKTVAGVKDSAVFDTMIIKTGEQRYGKLKGILLHRCFRSYAHAVEKINFYSSMLADDMFEKGRCPNPVRIVFEPLGAFLKAYTLRRYFLLGLDGFIESVIYAFSRTLRLAKARERFQEARYHKNG